MVVLGRPALDPLVSATFRCFIFGTLLVIVSLVFVKWPQYRHIIFYGSLFLMSNAIISLIASRFWLDSLSVSLFPPNLLASHYGWGGDMAEEGLIIEIYFILLLALSGLEGGIYWIINILNRK